MSVALGETLFGAFIAAGPDLLGGLGLDQLLQGPLGQLANEVGALPDAESSSRAETAD